MVSSLKPFPLHTHLHTCPSTYKGGDWSSPLRDLLNHPLAPKPCPHLPPLGMDPSHLCTCTHTFCSWGGIFGMVMFSWFTPPPASLFAFSDFLPKSHFLEPGHKSTAGSHLFHRGPAQILPDVCGPSPGVPGNWIVHPHRDSLFPVYELPPKMRHDTGSLPGMHIFSHS